MIVPEHDYSKNPPRLFWFDEVVLKALAEESGDSKITYFSQVDQRREDTGANDGDYGASDQQEYPLVPPVMAMAEFKTSPEVHMGYAATWYGLSVAGTIMTRKLITRGRG